MAITTIGFIGAGNMGTAMIKGLIKQGIVKAAKINAFDTSKAALDAIKADAGVNTAFASNTELVRASDLVIMAVKPQALKDVIAEIAGALDGKKPMISIVAGVPMAFYEKVAGKKFPLARCMPNTPALINAGVTAVAFSELATADFKADAKKILVAIGNVHEVAEKLLDAVTGCRVAGRRTCSTSSTGSSTAACGWGCHATWPGRSRSTRSLARRGSCKRRGSTPWC
jgi:pyrroline-5-carboxylate reductase